MDADTIAKEITIKVAEILEMDEAELWEDRKKHFFEDLGLDSLLALEIVASFEKKYRIEIEEERLTEITTLEQTINLVEELIVSKEEQAEVAV